MIVSKAYLLTFDRLDNYPYNYVNFHQNLASSPKITDWWHYLHSSYILISQVPILELNAEIRRLFVIEHAFLLIRVTLPESAGLLPADAWEWINRARY